MNDFTEHIKSFDLAINAVSEATPWVGYWMYWMMIIPLLGIFFIKKSIPARLAVATLPLLYPIGVTIYALTGKLYLAGIGHFIFWLPISIYILKEHIFKNKLNYKSSYGIWLILYTSTIIISLLFDARDITLVMMGEK